MRIGFDAKRAFLNNTGLGNYSRDTIRLLSHFYPDNKYFLYTPENNNIRLNFLSDNKNTFIKTPNSLIHKTFKSYWRSKGVVKELLTNRIEIYHGLSHEIPIGIEKTSIKTIVTIHDLIFIRYPHLFKTIDRKIYYYKFKSACERANKIIAVSNQTKKDIIDFLQIPESKITVVYQGCNKSFKTQVSDIKKKETLLKYEIDTNFLLYVGSIEKRKNLFTLLKTIKELPNQKLVIIGNGKSYKAKCLRYLAENNLSNRVIFLSDLTLNEIVAIYQSAQIMIYPSIFEGFGIPILESLFSKTPVITTKNGCFSETGGPHSKYITPLSINEMREAILEIQNSKELQKKMSEKGFEYAQNFTDDIIANNLMSVYKSL